MEATGSGVSCLLLLVTMVAVCEGNTCPCTIEGLDVRCNATSQFTFPRCIPSNVTAINFRRNFLVVHPGSVILRRFANLSSLDLSYNDLRFIPERFLHHSPKLRSLNLDYNKLRTLHPRTFVFSGQLASLSVVENPWLCDCQLKHSLDQLPSKCEVVGAWRTLCEKSVVDYYSIQGLRLSKKCNDKDL